MFVGQKCSIRQRHLSTPIRENFAGVSREMFTPFNAKVDNAIEVGIRGKNGYTEMSERT